MSEKKRVLVIGYGGAGSQATAHLAKNPNLRVTVVTPFDFMEVTLCTAKFLGLKEKVEEEHDKYMFPLLKEDNVDYVIASCTSLSNSSAALSNGQTIDFDACVVATGLKFPIFQLDPSHPSKEFRNSEIMGLNSSVQKAKHIVISGGGPVGCEAAADIKLRSPDKRLVIFFPYFFFDCLQVILVSQLFTHMKLSWTKCRLLFLSLVLKPCKIWVSLCYVVVNLNVYLMERWCFFFRIWIIFVVHELYSINCFAGSFNQWREYTL